MRGCPGLFSIWDEGQDRRGRRVLHTGDFRTCGFRGKAVLPTLARYAKGADALLLEGTALDQPDNPWSPVLKGFSHVEVLHTSGHAGREALGAVCGAVRPGVVIPLHTRAPERLEVPAPVRVLEDGEVYRV